MTGWSRILTAERMRVAEERVIAEGVSVQELMERAGAGIAEWVHRLAAGAPVLILCGPGNNGGDGYTTARILREKGVSVRVCALAPPKSEAAIEACKWWGGAVEAWPENHPDRSHYAPVVVDALFGTGLTRPLERRVLDILHDSVNGADLSVAVDMPSGLGTDDGGERMDHPPVFNVTLALGALKPAHVLNPATEFCGSIRVIEIGLGLEDIPSPHINVSPDDVIERPILHNPASHSHKYNRGMTVVIGGAMPGASALAAEAALRTGAGYGLLLNDRDAPCPHAIVQRRWHPQELADLAGDFRKQVSILIGPGLGRDKEARGKLDAAIAANRFLVIDGDALHLLSDDDFSSFKARASDTRIDNRVVLTPHAGEFTALFGKWSGSKIDAARAAAERSAATVVFKGADTVIAKPDGSTITAPRGPAWLSTAGTGDVLAGIIAGTYAQGFLFSNVEASVWLHAEAARRLGPAFIADDLMHAVSKARAAL